MDSINEQFLEEYKRLDKLCRDMYRSDRGVTEYIEHMKQITVGERRFVSTWDSDLRRLIDLRHIRNQLTHEVGTWHADVCTQEDVAWLRAFYERICRAEDPVGQLTKKRNQPKQNLTVSKHLPQRKPIVPQKGITSPTPWKEEEKDEEKGLLVAAIVIVAVVGVVLFLLSHIFFR